ncbi:arsenical pump-driving ATPase [Raineyella fluvialis]|uniref:Arsenical pump-driving ATPase n=1 Tax=Raineyella fluvialis TaxID=2662261 RepID=A0A5Q2F9H4_9ACTN|nr:arsenical pump-driving ATPase [Raineyella fluvialis]QGF23459.1 arsenical pump-driving ATPase [Raineyella fluvialis]
MRFLADPPRFLFFTGKGGVGKTSIACASAVRLTAEGRRVLLVSTDPASNVGQVFGATIGNRITPVPGLRGLDAVEIDPASAADQYRERIIGPVRAVLPEDEIASITEQLSGSCTTEIASFNEFTDFLADTATTAAYDHVIFDTAPTGHTLRLLQLPGDWTGFLDAGGEASCLGPMSGLEKHRASYANAVAALTDPARTRLVLVARPQPTSLAEAQRTARELDEIGLRATHLVLNAVLPEDAVGHDPLARAIRDREQRAITALDGTLAAVPRDEIDLQGQNMVGLEALRVLLSDGDERLGTPVSSEARPGDGESVPAPQGDQQHLDSLVEELAAAGHGLVMCMGKGGVGKTTIAAAVAVRLADLGHRVHLTTTDPAAHLDRTLTATADLPTLTISRIDPTEAIRDYREHQMATKGARLDAAGRAALAEDLMSPCNQEIAVFQKFTHLVNQAARTFVVMDTAPTGHTLLLMDTTGAYDRDVRRGMAPGMKFTTPLMRLQDPGYTHIVLVTLPETTPVLEALELRDDLVRADITPWAYVINQALSVTATSSPLLRRRAALEAEPIRTVEAAAPRLAVVPYLAEEPVGVARLRELTSSRVATTAPGT